MVRHRLTDEQWECIAVHFPRPAATGRPPRSKRELVAGMLWILRTGAPWRDLPEEEFGPWETVYYHFNLWSSDGTLDRILTSLKEAMAEAGELDHELWNIDGTIVRAHRCAAGGGKKTIRKSHRTTLLAAPAAAIRRRSISSAMGKATPCTLS